jgi:GWxTD domain-containing protein
MRAAAGGRFLPAVLAGAAVALGAAACTTAPRPDLDPQSRSFYETARLVLTGEEQDIFLHLPDAEARREFIVDFWAKRDPDPETEANEFKAEFEARIAYADAHFREGRRGINTDRGRIYVYLGPPYQTDYYPSYRDERGGMGPILLWLYPQYAVAVQFNDPKGTGDFAMTEVDGNLLQAVEDAKLGAVSQGAEAARRALRFEIRYDAAAGAFAASIPVKQISFKEAGGVLKAAFEFTFYIYKPGAPKKDMFTRTVSFEGSPAGVEKMPDLVFSFPYLLPPGKTYVDVIVVDRDGPGKARRIFALRG